MFIKGPHASFRDAIDIRSVAKCTIHVPRRLTLLPDIVSQRMWEGVSVSRYHGDCTKAGQGREVGDTITEHCTVQMLPSDSAFLLAMRQLKLRSRDV